ncbi:MAG: polysaccharide biosynthesis protein [Bacteroidales bacterium]|nr:polysaccharide biosynthesis protein [Bacteroidales bacterium]
MIFQNTYTPRWYIFIIDFLIVTISILLAYLLRFNFLVPVEYLHSLEYVLPLMLSVRIIGFVWGKTYAGIIRYTSSKDAERIFLVISLGTLVLFILNVASYFFNENTFLIPMSIIIIDMLTSIFLLTSFRIIVKSLYFNLNLSKDERKNIVIYGAGELGLITKRALDRDSEIGYNTVAFIDDNKLGQNQRLERITILAPNQLEQIAERHKISTLIFAKKNIPSEIKNKIADFCLNNNIKIQHVPNVQHWINGELSSKQIRNIKIEDLLQREPIILSEEDIRAEILGKSILVTGAAGSIGSEIVRQLTRYQPKTIILYDQAESPLYDLELHLSEELHFHNAKIIIGDVRNKNRLEYIFERYKPSIVYHAAAYKHVPMMEKNPVEAISTNILGTKNLADLSKAYEVKKFVFVSTDKAVNPTNVMGASKRIAEIYIQSLNQIASTQFITTRFGNVLGSNGSVIPRFRKQIENGGPVTITHPEITRFFMTIPEACQLVLEAGAKGNGGEIFVFDMGKSVKIVDLAKKMIKLYGLNLGIDIQIQYTGLRPGEKLYEELLNIAENTIPTHHNKILKAKVREYQLDEITADILELIELAKGYDNYKMVGKMKAIVPEFISKNSSYETLDQ